MMALVDQTAWASFIEWPHHPNDKEDHGWTQGDTKIDTTAETIKLSNGDLYYG